MQNDFISEYQQYCMANDKRTLQNTLATYQMLCKQIEYMLANDQWNPEMPPTFHFAREAERVTADFSRVILDGAFRSGPSTYSPVGYGGFRSRGFRPGYVGPQNHNGMAFPQGGPAFGQSPFTGSHSFDPAQSGEPSPAAPDETKEPTDDTQS